LTLTFAPDAQAMAPVSTRALFALTVQLEIFRSDLSAKIAAAS
jgi:hypothetical protein